MITIRRADAITIATYLDDVPLRAHGHPSHDDPEDPVSLEEADAFEDLNLLYVELTPEQARYWLSLCADTNLRDVYDSQDQVVGALDADVVASR